MGRQHNALASLDGRRDGFGPERHDPRHGVLQAFCQRHLFWSQLGVARVTAFAALVVRRQGWWWYVVAAAPGQHLFVAKFFGRFGFVQTLQGTVMAFVQAPTVHHGQPSPVHLVEHMPERAGRPLQHTGVRHVELVVFIFQQFASAQGLGDAGRRQVDVGPAGEAVFKIPSGLAVADKH